MSPLPGSNFGKLWVARTISNLGDGVAVAAFPLLAASLTRVPVLIALVSFALQLPWLLVALPAGGVADRVDRRRGMAWVDVGRGAVLALLVVALAAGQAGMALVLAAAFLLGTGETFVDTASQSILPAVVPDDRLESSNSRLFAAEVAANQFVGPAMGGALFAAAAILPFLIDAGSYLVAAALILAMQGDFKIQLAPKEPRPGLRREIAEGLRWTWEDKVLRAMTGLSSAGNFSYAAAEGILVLLALEVLGMGADGFGLLLGAHGAGGLIGAAVASRLARRLGRGGLILGSFAATGLALVLAGATDSPLVAGGAFVILGAALMAWRVMTVSLRQAIVPSRLLGRVNSVYRFVGRGSAALGALAGGWVSQVLGLRAPFLLGGVVVVLAAVAGMPWINNRRVEGSIRP